MAERSLLSFDTARRSALFLALLLVGVLIVAALILTAVLRPHLRVKCLCALLAVLLFMVGGMRAGSYFVSRYGKVRSLVGETVELTLSVREARGSSAAYARYGITVEEVSVDGERRDLPSFDAVLAIDGAGEFAQGDRLRLSAVCRALSELYSQPSYALAEGYFVGFEVTVDDENAKDRIVRLEASAENDTAVRRMVNAFARFRDRLSYVFLEELEGDVGALASAVLLGDRSMLDASVTRDFGRAGISHLLALSGLHLNILIGGFAGILKRLGAPRSAVSVLTLCGVLAFLLLTGFSMSACRAGLMLGYVAVVGLFSRKPDVVTSLFGAVALILWVFPSSVASVGLWMSFSSVLGLLMLAPKWNAFFERRFPRREGESLMLGLRHGMLRLLLGIVSGIGVSLIASFSVLPVLYLTSGEFSLFGTVTNLLTVFLMSAFLVLCLSYLVFRRVTLIGTVTVVLFRAIGGWILSVAAYVSGLPNAVVSLSFPRVGICVAVFLLPTLVLLMVSRDTFGRVLDRLKGRRTAHRDVKVRELSARWFLLPPLIATVLFTFCLQAHFAQLSEDALPVTVMRVSGGEMLAVQDGASAVLIDLSDGYYSGYREAYAAVREHAVTECSRFVLTHYSSRQISSVLRFCREYPTMAVLLPTPSGENETALSDAIARCLSEHRIGYAYYSRNEALAVSDTVTLTLSDSAYIERSAQPAFLLRINAEEESLTYLAGAVEETKLWREAELAIRESEVVIYGSDGPVRRRPVTLPVEETEIELLLTFGADASETFDRKTLKALEESDGVLWMHGEKICYVPDRRTVQSGAG